jgi:hypothetical protein
MEMFRNMEVVLMLSFGLIVTAALVGQPAAREERILAQDNAATQMPVVVITGKRLSTGEKAQASQEAG